MSPVSSSRSDTCETTSTALQTSQADPYFFRNKLRLCQSEYPQYADLNARLNGFKSFDHLEALAAREEADNEHPSLTSAKKAVAKACEELAREEQRALQENEKENRRRSLAEELGNHHRRKAELEVELAAFPVHRSSAEKRVADFLADVKQDDPYQQRNLANGIAFISQVPAWVNATKQAIEVVEKRIVKTREQLAALK